MTTPPDAPASNATTSPQEVLDRAKKLYERLVRGRHRGTRVEKMLLTLGEIADLLGPLVDSLPEHGDEAYERRAAEARDRLAAIRRYLADPRAFALGATVIYADPRDGEDNVAEHGIAVAKIAFDAVRAACTLAVRFR